MDFRSRIGATAAILIFSVAALLGHQADCFAKKRKIILGGQRAVVIDERLAALREAPDLSAPLAERLSRGRPVSILGAKKASDGTSFFRVAVTRNTRGWVQSEALGSPTRVGDDARFVRLIRASEDFERIARAHIFLESFPRSPLRPTVLLLFGDAAEEAASRLTRDAVRRLDEQEMIAGGAPAYTYYMNFGGLDRYNRAGIRFVFDRANKVFHYNGDSWREIMHRFPNSPEAVEAHKRLDPGSSTGTRKV